MEIHRAVCGQTWRNSLTLPDFIITTEAWVLKDEENHTGKMGRER